MPITGLMPGWHASIRSQNSTWHIFLHMSCTAVYTALLLQRTQIGMHVPQARKHRMSSAHAPPGVLLMLLPLALLLAVLLPRLLLLPRRQRRLPPCSSSAWHRL